MSSKALWAVIGVILAPAVVLPLLVGIYDSTDPTLFGFPFYFWFQFAMIVLAVALTTVALFLSHAADRRAREEHGREGGVR